MGSLSAKSKSPTNASNALGGLNVEGAPPPAAKKSGKPGEEGAAGTDAAD